MLLYVEKNIIDHPRTQCILRQFPRATVIPIRNYKNYYDVDHGTLPSTQSMIIARAPKNPISPAPDGYGFAGVGLFLKTSLGCIYDCEYCYLKGMFRNDTPVYFVDYEYIWGELVKKIEAIRKRKTEPIYIYCSDYSDIQGMDVFSGFNAFFLPRIDDLEHVLMESRTKSPNIQSLLAFGTPASNTEISFSLNPQKIIDTYERGTATLDQRIHNIQTLLNRGWKVGIRIIPLMPVSDFESIYTNFIQKIQQEIKIQDLHSMFIGGLMYTKRDFKKIQKKGYLEDM